ncbi:hypothetical protein GSI_12588 [Ganoderma sinense ZZ0214-1]|uniref:Uncharacterized protein n=1 Tax=Ganoderma sinense ZZ0214-1 TaxID=1077348 RepID=A0A2G8RT65_9APHY|nr:hypothetical protein GSI_12588 [Ganoderma sinense ZZ0214-1]
MCSEGSYPHAVGDIYATPVLFVHGGNAVLGGSAVGQVGLWDVTTQRKHFTLRLQDKDRVLALAAHYDRSHDRFFIATGISNPDAEEAVVIWSATGSRVASVPWPCYTQRSLLAPWWWA